MGMAFWFVPWYVCVRKIKKDAKEDKDMKKPTVIQE